MDSSTLYQSAYDLHYKKGDFETAISVYKEVIKRFPNSSEARYSTTQLSNISKNGYDIENYGNDEAATSIISEIEEVEKLEIAEMLKMKKYDNILISTTSEIYGYIITKHIGIVSSQIVLGTGIFSELSAGINDIFGLRSKTLEAKFQKVHNAALNSLKLQARDKLANGVVGAKFDFSMLGPNMVNLVITGTAVEIEKKE